MLRRLLAFLCGALLTLLPAGPAMAASGSAPSQASRSPALAVPSGSAATALAYRCDGELLTAILHGGAVDDPSIPNRSGGTLPGAFMQLNWQQPGGPLALQLPRTNNAGAPSFTDGKWWWSLEDPQHPRFRLRLGSGQIRDIACEVA